MAEDTRSRRGQWWRRHWVLLTAVLLLAVNLRPTAAAPGPVLRLIAADLGFGPSVAGLLTGLPVLCFAGFGALAPWAAHWFGMHRVVIVSMGLLVAGQIVRLGTGSTAVFLAASVLALAGMATSNVLLPSLVKMHFPTKIGLATAAYSTSLITGLTAASTLTAPLAEVAGWRRAMWVWVVLAVIALAVWLPNWRRDRHHVSRTQGRRIGFTQVARTPLGWQMALFFGFQSAQAYSVFGWLASIYQDAGFGRSVSGLYLGVATGVGIPLGFLLPAYTARRPAYPLIWLIAGGGATAYLGLWLAPRAAPGLWAVLLALGTAAFPVFLALIGQRAHTSEGTAALSAFSQSVGYLIAFPGPLLVGVLRGATNGFAAALLMLIASMIPLTVFALLSCRPGYIEDQVAGLTPGPASPSGSGGETPTAGR